MLQVVNWLRADWVIEKGYAEWLVVLLFTELVS